MSKRILLIIGIVFAPLVAHGGIQPRIIGGDDVTVAAEASFVSALVSNDDNGVFCTASLIAPNWIMVAAHCLVLDNDSSLAPEDLDVFFDNIDKASGLSDRQSVDAVLIHPSYNDITLDYDIALLHLPTPATGVDTGSVADLDALARMLDSAAGDDELLLYGWGAISLSGELATYPDTLQQVRMDFLDAASCNAYYNIPISDALHVCAWEPDPEPLDENGEDSCFGDSGGPLISDVDGQPWIVGMTSFGPDAGCGLIEGEPFPSVYANVARLAGWLESASATFEPLVDLAPALSPDNLLMSASGSASIELSLSNASSNAISAYEVDVSGDALFSLSPTLATLSCDSTNPSFNCDGAAVNGNDVDQEEFDLTWGGATSAERTLVFTTSTDQDMRSANNSAELSVSISDLPDLILTLPSTVSGSISTSISGQLSNRSLDVSATGVTLDLTGDSDVLITSVSIADAAASCTGLDSANVICILGTVPASTAMSLEIGLDGGGRASLIASLSSPDGDYDLADNDSEVSVDLLASLLESGSRDGGPVPFAFLVLLLCYSGLRWKISCSQPIR